MSNSTVTQERMDDMERRLRALVNAYGGQSQELSKCRHLYDWLAKKVDNVTFNSLVDEIEYLENLSKPTKKFDKSIGKMLSR